MALLALAFVTTACPEQKREPNAPPETAEQKAERERRQREAVVTGVSIGIDTAARGLGLGIQKVKENRLAGKSKRSRAEQLALAKKAQKFNAAMRKVAEYLLSRSELNDPDRRTLAEDVDDMMRLAREIGSVTISTDAGRQFAFDLGLMAAKATLQSSAGAFLRSIPTGDALIVSASAKSALQDALHHMDTNDDALDRSIEELGGQAQARRDGRARVVTGWREAARFSGPPASARAR
jgi:hypothetical protein